MTMHADVKQTHIFTGWTNEARQSMSLVLL